MLSAVDAMQFESRPVSRLRRRARRVSAAPIRELTV
jgi:hypothetical protein